MLVVCQQPTGLATQRDALWVLSRLGGMATERETLAFGLCAAAANGWLIEKRAGLGECVGGVESPAVTGRNVMEVKGLARRR